MDISAMLGLGDRAGSALWIKNHDTVVEEISARDINIPLEL